MPKQCRHTRWLRGLLFALALLTALPAGADEVLLADAGQATLEEASGYLAAMINSARRDPLATAASLGRDPKRVLADLPQLADVLTRGLAPLTVDERLGAAAAGHADDVFANGRYDILSSDGRTVEDRMIAAGYDPGAAGESLGFLGFMNYVSARSAAEKMFTKLFLDELDPARKTARHILNAEFSDLGLSMGSGRWKADGVDYNAYVAVCDFASTSGRLRLLALINQARRDPLGFAAALGLDPRQIQDDFPFLASLLKDGMAPVSLNSLLNVAAQLHTSDMLRRNYFSTLSPDASSQCIPGKTLAPPGGPWKPVFCRYETHIDRMRAAGYESGEAGESLGILRFDDYVEEDDALERMFADMYAAELDPKNTAKWNILDPKFSEVGIGSGVGPLSPGLLPGEANAYLITLDFGSPRR